MATLLFTGASGYWDGGTVVKLSSGTKLAIVGSNGQIRVYDDPDGSPSLIASATASTIFGETANICGFDAALDSSDVLHFAAHCDSPTTGENDVRYNTLSGIDSTPTWGTWETIAAYTDGNSNNAEGCSIRIRLDGDDYPHVLWTEDYKYKAGLYPQPYYSHDVGSGWITKERVATTDTESFYTIGMEVMSDGDVEVVYAEYGGGGYYYRRRNGSWGTVNSWSTYDANYVPRGGGASRLSDDTVYRYGVSSSNLIENDSDTGYNGGTYRQNAAAVLGTYRWLVYCSNDQTLNIAYNSGSGWNNSAEYTVTSPDVIYAVHACNTRLNNGFADGVIGYVFLAIESGAYNLYYDEYDAGGGPATDDLAVSNLTLPDHEVGTPTFGQKHNLGASNLTLVPHAVGTPTFGQKHVLGVSDLALPAIIVGTPVCEDIGATHNLAVSNLVLPDHEVGTPTFGQKHVLGVSDLELETHIVGTPTCTEVAGTHNLAVSNLVLSPIEVGEPTIGQIHALAVTTLALLPHAVGTPAFGQKHVLGVSDLELESHIVGTPTCTDVGATHNLAVSALVLAAMLVGSPTLTEIEVSGKNRLIWHSLVGVPFR